MAAISKNIQMSKRKKLPNSLRPRAFLYGCAKGFKKGGGAFARWHITSTDISEESFPKLKTIIGRHFKYASAVSLWLMLLLFMLLPKNVILYFSSVYLWV